MLPTFGDDEEKPTTIEEDFLPPSTLISSMLHSMSRNSHQVNMADLLSQSKKPNFANYLRDVL